MFLAKTKLLLVTVAAVIIFSSCGIDNKTNKEGPTSTKESVQIASPSAMVDNNPAPSLFSNISCCNTEKFKTYDHDDFSVAYPNNWEVYIEESISSADLMDGNPQNGIIIYVDSIKDETIYDYHQIGHITIPPSGFTIESFTTASGNEGQILYIKSDGNITAYLILEDEFDGAIIMMSETSFEKYKQEVYTILNSITLKNKPIE